MLVAVAAAAVLLVPSLTRAFAWVWTESDLNQVNVSYSLACLPSLWHIFMDALTHTYTTAIIMPKVFCWSRLYRLSGEKHITFTCCFCFLLLVVCAFTLKHTPLSRHTRFEQALDASLFEMFCDSMWYVKLGFFQSYVTFQILARFKNRIFYV